MLSVEQSEIALEQSVIVVRTERDVIEVVGPDAATYLHGQLSQQVDAMPVGAVGYTLLLQPQGKVDAWMRLHRVDEQQFRLDVDAGFGPSVQERLERFRLRMRLDIAVDPTPVLAVRGPQAGQAVAEASLPASTRPVAVPPLTVGSDDRPGDAVDLFTTDPDGVIDALAGRVDEAPPEALELWRIGTGRPAMGTELDDSTIPAAAGIVGVSVDFAKGCYVGQELVARVDSRGSNTPTRLVRLVAAQVLDAPAGAPLLVAGSEVGTVTSAVRSPSKGTRALAYVKRGVEVPGPVTVRAGDRTVEAVLEPTAAPG